MLKVSVITPTYNHERFIARCLNSVRQQTYPLWEQIVIDDGSTDCTWDIIEKYASEDSRIVPVRQSNVGILRLAETYNRALSMATGELIAILEGDDFWPLRKLEEQLMWHERAELTFSYGKVQYVCDRDNINEYGFVPSVRGIQANTVFLRLLLTLSFGLEPSTIVIRRSALETIGGFHQDPAFPAIDFSTMVRLCLLPGQSAFIDSLLGYYRQHDEQITRINGVELAEGSLRISQAVYDDLSVADRQALGISMKDIVQSRHRLIADSHLARMRLALRQKDRPLAMKSVKELWKNGGTKRRTEAVVGLIAAWSGTNLEPLFHLYESVVMRR